MALCLLQHSFQHRFILTRFMEALHTVNTLRTLLANELYDWNSLGNGDEFFCWWCRSNNGGTLPKFLTVGIFVAENSATVLGVSK